jgi:hypothetical protein
VIYRIAVEGIGKHGYAELIAHDLRQQGKVVSVVNCRRRSSDIIYGENLATWLHYWGDFVAMVKGMPMEDEDVIIFDGHPKYAIHALSTVYGSVFEATTLQFCMEQLIPEAMVDLAIVVDEPLDGLITREEFSLHSAEYLTRLRRAYLGLAERFSEVRIVGRTLGDEGWEKSVRKISGVYMQVTNNRMTSTRV